MSYSKQIGEYKKNAAIGASPVGLVVMLYDGALRFLDQGKRAMVQKNLEEQNRCLQRAQKIVAELMSSLNMNDGGDVAKNLLALYTYALTEIVNGNMEDSPTAIDNAARTLSELREGWAALERQQRAISIEPDERVSIAQAA